MNARTMELSTKVLVQNKVNFDVRNNGQHLIIRGKAAEFDFWPSTGRWKRRGGDGQYYSGVFNLLKEI